MCEVVILAFGGSQCLRAPGEVAGGKLPLQWAGQPESTRA